MIPASRNSQATERALYERDVSTLPMYDPADVAVSLRSARARQPAAAVMPDAEHQLRMAQMDYYASRSAHNSRHTFDYDPCRSK